MTLQTVMIFKHRNRFCTYLANGYFSFRWLVYSLATKKDKRTKTQARVI